MAREIIATVHAPQAIGTYSQAIKVGSTVYLSGQIPLQPNTMQVVAGDMQEQIRQVFENLKAVAQAAGGSLDKLVKLNIFLTDLSHFPLVNEVMSKYFTQPYPARAAIGVASLPKEVGVHIMDDKIILEENGKKIFLAHGDGLGPGDFGYKMIKKIFTNKMCRWLFTRLHPNFGLGIAHFWSKRSRIANNKNPEQFLGEEKEWLVSYCKEKQKENPVDYYIFGHRHLPLEIEIDTKAKYINLGDWVHHNSYAVFDGENLILEYLN